MNKDWYNKCELPPVGAVVEVKHKGCWQKTKIIGHDDGWAVYPCEGFDDVRGYDAGYPKLFRPLRTEMDKLVEQMVCDMSDADRGTGENAHMVARSLVEQGYRKIKQQSEDEFAIEITSLLSKYNTDWQGILYQAGCRFIEQGE